MSDVTSETHLFECREKIRSLLQAGYNVMTIAKRLEVCTFYVEREQVYLNKHKDDISIAHYDPVLDLLGLPLGMVAKTLPKTLRPLKQEQDDREIEAYKARRVRRISYTRALHQAKKKDKARKLLKRK